MALQCNAQLPNSMEALIRLHRNASGIYIKTPFNPSELVDMTHGFGSNTSDAEVLNGVWKQHCEKLLVM
jgi:hypothetical protein